MFFYSIFLLLIEKGTRNHLQIAKKKQQQQQKTKKQNKKIRTKKAKIFFVYDITNRPLSRAKDRGKYNCHLHRRHFLL